MNLGGARVPRRLSSPHGEIRSRESDGLSDPVAVGQRRCCHDQKSHKTEGEYVDSLAHGGSSYIGYAMGISCRCLRTISEIRKDSPTLRSSLPSASSHVVAGAAQCLYFPAYG